MEFFKIWLRSRRGIIGVFLLFFLLYFAVFALYGLPLAAVLYPTLLCILAGTALLLADLRRARRKHTVLSNICALSSALMNDVFPSAESFDDGDYQAIIEHLRRELAALSDDMNAHYADMVEYYTVWAHQIKTPIASMRLHLQNEDSPLSRQLSGDLMRIEQYVEMVLAFLRLEEGVSDYVIRACELDDIVRSALRKFAPEFIGRGLRLEYEPLNASVITDEKWLSFVVEQLLSNALKYTPEGGIRIYMADERTLCVQDTGIGIAPEDLPRIFEKGYTGFNGRADRTASGIGLYLCRRICRNLGHSLSAVSVPEKGTELRIGFGENKTIQD